MARPPLDQGAIVVLSGPRADEARALLRQAGLAVVDGDAMPPDDLVVLADRAGVVGLLSAADDGVEERCARRGVPYHSGAVSAVDALRLVDRRLEVATRPIFVIGFGRSGTTWTFELLTEPLAVGGVFEALLIAPEHQGWLRDPEGFEPRFTEDDRRYPIGLGQLASREEAVEAMRATAVRWLARQVGPEHEWLVEKTPSQSHAIAVSHELFPRARFVHVVRDPRDGVVSRLALQGPRGRGVLTRLRTLRAVERWATEWVRTMHRVDEAAAWAPIHEVRYEDLHARSVPTLRGLYEFCGIPYGEGELEQTFEHNAIDRHELRGTGRFRHRGEAGAWRDDLSAFNQAIVRAGAGEEMVRRGYLSKQDLLSRGLAATARRLRAGG